LPLWVPPGGSRRVRGELLKRRSARLGLAKSRRFQVNIITAHTRNPRIQTSIYAATKQAHVTTFFTSEYLDSLSMWINLDQCGGG
jgi:hypothetical protein